MHKGCRETCVFKSNFFRFCHFSSLKNAIFLPDVCARVLSPRELCYSVVFAAMAVSVCVI